MKNLMNCAKKVIICVVLVVVVFFNSVGSVFAAEPLTTTIVVGAAQIAIDKLVDVWFSEVVSAAEKEAALEGYKGYWWSYDVIDDAGVEVTYDVLAQACLELNNMGQPCEIVEFYNGYYIKATGPFGHYYYEGSSGGFGADYIWNNTGLIFSNNMKNLVYCPYDQPSSYLSKIYNEFGTYIDGIEESLDLVYYRLTKIYDFLTGYTDAAGNQPGTNLYDKLDELVTAIEGISDSAANFDTTPITDKLEEVISSTDANFSALLTDLSTNTDRIVSAIPDPVDLSAVNSRIDAVVEEVQKISTFADLHEVVTVTPGVLGDVNVVTTGGWVYDYLSFHYEFVNPEFSAVANTEYISGDWFIDYDSGTGSYIYELQDRNYVGANAVRFSAADNYWVPSGASPVYIEVNYQDGDPLVLDVGNLKGTPYTVSLDEVTYARIYVEYGGDRWLEDTGGGALVGITYGDYSYPVADQLSFTVDGVPHTLYFTNEYEFDSCSYGDFIYYDEGQGMWYLENINSSGGGVPLTYYNAYLTDALTSAPTTTTTMEGETYTWFEWFYTSYKGGGSVDVTPVVNKLKDIENALSNMGSTIDIENNTNINIDEGDENYNIFYVDDPDGGEDKSIVDLSGDTLTVFGKLLNFLYKVGFKGALDNAGGGIGDLSDFYLDDSEGSADLWVS